MSRYLLTDEAKLDIAEIRKYLVSEAGPRVALSVIRKVKAAFQLLGQTPGTGHSREDLAPTTVSFWPVYNYMIG